MERSTDAKRTRRSEAKRRQLQAQWTKAPRVVYKRKAAPAGIPPSTPIYTPKPLYQRYGAQVRIWPSVIDPRRSTLHMRFPFSFLSGRDQNIQVTRGPLKSLYCFLGLRRPLSYPSKCFFEETPLTLQKDFFSWEDASQPFKSLDLPPFKRW